MARVKPLEPEHHGVFELICKMATVDGIETRIRPIEFDSGAVVELRKGLYRYCFQVDSGPVLTALSENVLFDMTVGALISLLSYLNQFEPQKYEYPIVTSKILSRYWPEYGGN